MTLNSDSIPNKYCKREEAVFTNLFKLALIASIGIANAQSESRSNDSNDGWRLIGKDGWSTRYLKVDSVRPAPAGVAYSIRYDPISGKSPSWERTAIVNCLERTRYEITNDSEVESRQFKATIAPGSIRSTEIEMACEVFAQKHAPVTAAPLATPPISHERPTEALTQVPVSAAQFSDTAYQSKETEACLLKLIDDAKIRPLTGKLAFDLDKPLPIDMLANLTKAAPKEKAALNFYSTEWQRCQELGADWRKRKLGPDIAALFSALQVDLSAGLADLYAGQISYGSAAKLRAKQWIEFKNGAEATERRHSAQAAENEKQRQIQMQKDTAAAQERAAQERSRQQAEVNQRQAEQDRIAQRQANEQERKSRDSDACKSQAAAARPAPKNDSQTTCTNFGGIVNCNTSSAQPSGFAAGFARGMANIDEARSFKNCMVARGWNPKD
jgi:hypothetical protein